MNKKLICTLMAGALLVGTVTGCGSSSEGESSAKGTELELFSSKAENKDILQKLVDKFNETHKDVTIKITAPADAGTVLKTRMAKNDMPDIVAMGGDNNYTEVESAGMLVDLSSEDYVSNIQESYLQMVYDVNKDKEEKVYGVPYATNASGVIYNVDKFKEHGIEIPKTWDEFIDVLEKLQDAGEQPLLMTYKDAWTSNCPWNSIASDLAQSVIFCGQFIHAILFCSLLLRLLSFDFSLRIFLAQAGQYLDAPEPGTYSTPHTVQFLAGIAAHRFVGMICNSSTKPMNL